jgi:glycosyltransferase involved in cell wall biosynthesis
MVDVVVAIPTFRRPQSLLRLLKAIERLQTGAAITVIVADNDMEKHEGFDACQKLIESGYGWPLDHFIVAERGIANVRNALVARALAKHFDFIAMLDDDEWPQPNWIEAFLRTQEATCADALHGAVLREFEAAPGHWASRCDGVAHMHAKTGVVESIPGTGNVLFARACFEVIQAPWFDPAFALCGGEDSDFLERLRRLGRRFAWCDEAIVHAWVPTSRGNLKWALSRAYSTGNSDMRVFLKYSRSDLERFVEGIKISGALLLTPLLFVILGFGTNRAVDALRKLFRAAGKLAAICGRYYDEYSVTHGA